MKILSLITAVSGILLALQFQPQSPLKLKANDFQFIENALAGNDRIKNLPQASINEKFDLWRGDKTLLRGANTWQKLKDNRIEPTYTPTDFSDLAARKANFVNLSHPGTFSEDTERGATREDREKKYRLQATAMNNLKQMVRFSEDAGLFSVVAFRTGPERREKIFNQENPSPSKLWRNAAAQTAWVEMWRETALALKDSKTVVGYDLMVEPDPENPSQWNALAKRIIEAIRAVDPKTPIIIEPASGGTIEALGNLNPQELDPRGDLKIVYAVHQYEPTDYAQQAEGKFVFKCNDSRGDKNGQPNSRQYAAYDNARRTKLKAEYKTLNDWRATHGNVPVVVNEFGVVRWAGGWENNAPKPDADIFIEEQINLIEALAMNYAIWKWDPKGCLGDDDFNFRNGQIFTNHKDTDNNLYRKIMLGWERNEIYPKDFLNKF